MAHDDVLRSTAAGTTRRADPGRTLALVRAATRRQLVLRYRHSLLGIGWNLLQPVAIVAVYGLVFTQVLAVDGGDLPYLTMAWAGVVCWSFVQVAWQQGAWSYLHDADLLRKVWVPRVVQPLTPVLAGTVDLAVGVALLVVVAVVQGVALTPTMAAIAPALLLVVLWAAVLSLWTAPLAARVRDVTTAVTVVVRLGFIVTPVMYPASLLPERWRWTAALNPFAVAIDAIRDALAGRWPDAALIAIHLVAGSALALVGLRVVSRTGARLVDAL